MQMQIFFLLKEAKSMRSSILGQIWLLANYMALRAYALHKRAYEEDRTDFTDPFHKPLFRHTLGYTYPTLDLKSSENVV